MQLFQSMFRSPLGEFALIGGDAGLRALLPVERVGGWPVPIEKSAHPVLEAAAQQLTKYFDGTLREFSLPLDLIGTPFQKRAWLGLQSIRYGETRSYGEQAKYQGSPGAARAIGAANGRNPIWIVVPCHRIIGAGGDLTGYAGGFERKRWLLDWEHRNAVQSTLFEPSAGIPTPSNAL
ncbi:MAG: methylated-DNA-[protein]-cysteine S-methyltransferase [Abditibacteriota bacterium]|jgi:methylated-DNA-[protein]-cysteine S-methyltransferase|nr:methylated-DNA-[protein]-cysteine S-methyltransferase [Abditibacteriota bacterium]